MGGGSGKVLAAGRCSVGDDSSKGGSREGRGCGRSRGRAGGRGGGGIGGVMVELGVVYSQTDSSSTR